MSKDDALYIDPLNRDVFYTDFYKSDDPEDNGETSAKFFTRLCKVMKKPATFVNGVAVDKPELAVEPVEYIEIIAKKFKDIFIGKATDADRQRFSTAYAEFKKAKAAKTKQEPVEEFEETKKKVASK